MRRLNVLGGIQSVFDTARANVGSLLWPVVTVMDSTALDLPAQDAFPRNRPLVQVSDG